MSTPSVIPEMTASASGRCSSAPKPTVHRMGSKPSTIYHNRNGQFVPQLFDHIFENSLIGMIDWEGLVSF